MKFGVLAAVVVLSGCAAKHVTAPKEQQRFFQTCSETTQAKADGYKHFTCTDVAGKLWEVKVKPQQAGRDAR